MRVRGMPGGLAAGAAAVVLVMAAAVGGPVGAAVGAAEQEAPRIETILDVSGSMQAADIGGGTRMQAAKDAMFTLIDGAPARAELGVRLYGASYPGRDKGKGCRDTRLISPIAPMDVADKDRVKAALGRLKPVGFTPVGPALRAAAKDLGGRGERRIILVSDGEDTCAPPEPCEIAKELAGPDGGSGSGSSSGLVIDTLGFKVSGKAERQLRCIAEAAGGTYRPASDAGQLSAALQGAFKAALKGYRANGLPLAGGSDCAKAPRVEPGQYLDRIRRGEQRWYRVRVRPGQSLRASGTWISERGQQSDGGPELMAAVVPEGAEPGHGQDLATSRAVGQDGANFRSVGAVTERLGWKVLRRGRSAVDLCVVIRDGEGEAAGAAGGARGRAEPLELKLSLAGRPLTRDDLKDPTRAERERGDEPGTLVESPARKVGTRSGPATDAAGSDSGDSSDPIMTSPVAVGGTAAGGLLLGALGAALLLRGRSGRGGGGR